MRGGKQGAAALSIASDSILIALKLAAGAVTGSIAIVTEAVHSMANLAVSEVLYRQARIHESPALEGDAAHLRTDAMTSAGVLVGHGLVEVTGAAAVDSITALCVAAAIVWAGIRIIRRSSGVLVDEALPDSEMDKIERAIAAARTPEVAGYHKLRARRAGRRRHIDFHVQYISGTTLERAHELAHEMRASIEAEIPQADVLIHAEPETSYRERESGPYRSG